MLLGQDIGVVGLPPLGKQIIQTNGENSYKYKVVISFFFAWMSDHNS